MAQRDVDDIIVVGAPSHPLRDAYRRLLTVRWWAAIGTIVLAFLSINAVFATGFVLTGGIEGMPGHGSFADAFFFSAQTLGTIGYGAMHPVSLAANVLVVGETIVGILFIAVATGIVFARFSRSTEAVRFVDRPCISLMDGVPTLFLRIGNDRDGAIIDAQINCAFVHTHHTKEGQLLYRMRDLTLVRSRTPALARTWTVMHVIDPSSPFWEATPESLAAMEMELGVSVVGTDGTSLQPVHGRCRYLAADLLWGYRFVDILQERADGKLVLDVRKFHQVTETTPTDAFPYPADGSAS